MKTSAKHLSDTKVELTITLDAGELKTAEHVALAKLAKQIKVAGFRKGKVPASIAAKNVDPEALSQETVQNALSKGVAEAFISEDIQVLDRPAVEIKKFVPGQELEFTAEAEILPAVKLGNYKKLKAKKAKVVVSSDEIDEIIERMRSSFATKEEVTRSAKDGDEVTIDFVGKKDGVAFDGGTAKDYVLTLGSNSFIPGFESGIVGKKIGETFDLEISFPDNYHVAELKGSPVIFTTTLSGVKEVVLPKVDDKFAAKAGPFKTVKDLKDDIKRELTAQKDRETTEKLKDELVKELVEVSTIPAPEILVKDQAESIERDMLQNLTYQNITPEQYFESRGFKSKEDWQKTEVSEAATNRVKAGLALAELVKVEGITVSDADTDKEVAKYKQSYANNPAMAARFDTAEAKRDIKNRLHTEKAVDRLVEVNA